MSLTPDTVILPQVPFSRSCVLTAAETAFHNPTSAVDLITAAENVNGALITKLYGLARGNNAAANTVALYKRVGSTYTLIDTATLPAGAPSATDRAPKADFGVSRETPMELGAGEGLAMSTGAAVTNGAVGRAEGRFY